MKLKILLIVILLRSLAFGQTQEVLFSVDMSNVQLNSNGYVFFVCDYLNWVPYQMNSAGDGIYNFNISLPIASTIEYKFRNGNSNENGSSLCGVSDGSGGYNRTFTIPSNYNAFYTYNLPLVCYNECSTCLKTTDIITQFIPGSSNSNFSSIAFDVQGNMYYTEYNQNIVFKKDIFTGIVSNFAGTGVAGSSGDGGLAINAQLNHPEKVEVDGIGNVYILDFSNFSIRTVNTAGIISTVVGGGANYRGIAVDNLNNLYYTSLYQAKIYKRTLSGTTTIVAGNGQYGYSGDGGLAINAKIGYTGDIAIDDVDNLYLWQDNSTIRKVNLTSGIITTIAGNTINGFSGDGGLAINAQIRSEGKIFAKNGVLLIADSYNSRIRSIDVNTGIIKTIAGNGTNVPPTFGVLAINSSVGYPKSVSMDTQQNIYISTPLQIVKIPCSFPVRIIPTSSCVDADNGTATAICVGTGGFTYQWTNPFSPTIQNTSTATNLTFYTSLITDSYGCVNKQSGNCFRQQIINANPISQSLICYGDNNGFASVNPNGGQIPYSYLWNNLPTQTSNTISNLNGGNYMVTITDSLGCSSIQSFYIYEPNIYEYTNTQNNNINCSGVCNGNITLIASGGTSPYNYHWTSNVSTPNSPSITGLCPDTYSFTITDNNNCVISDSIKLTPLVSLDSQVYLTNIAAVDQNNVDPAFAAYYSYDLPATINSNATNPLNLVDPGKSVRFKVQSKNQKNNGQSIVSGSCRVRTNSPWITLTDSTSALNNIAWNSQAWSADEFEININASTPPGTNAYLDFIVQENGNNYATTCIAIPIRPLVYSPTISTTIDDDNNPDSQGNDNDICEPGETIEFYPWLDNKSTFNAKYVRGNFENLANNSFINIWNNQAGISGTVYNSSWWNYGFGTPQSINIGNTNMTPEFDFVFDYNNGAPNSTFDLNMVMAGGFNLFSSNGPLTLVKWSLPYTFSGTSGTVGINSQTENTLINLKPNPTKGNVTISNIKDKHVQITDIAGQIIYAKEKASSIEIIDLSLVSQGIYFVKLSDDSGFVVKKVVKE